MDVPAQKKSPRGIIAYNLLRGDGLEEITSIVQTAFRSSAKTLHHLSMKDYYDLSEQSLKMLMFPGILDHPYTATVESEKWITHGNLNGAMDIFITTPPKNSAICKYNTYHNRMVVELKSYRLKYSILENITDFKEKKKRVDELIKDYNETPNEFLKKYTVQLLDDNGGKITKSLYDAIGLPQYFPGHLRLNPNMNIHASKQETALLQLAWYMNAERHNILKNKKQPRSYEKTVVQGSLVVAYGPCLFMVNLQRKLRKNREDKQEEKKEDQYYIDLFSTNPANYNYALHLYSRHAPTLGDPVLQYVQSSYPDTGSSEDDDNDAYKETFCLTTSSDSD